MFLVGLGPSPDGIPRLASRLRMCQQRDNCTVLDHRCCASWPELEASGWPKAASSGDMTFQRVKQRALGQAQTAQQWRFRQGLRFFRHLLELDLIPYNATHTSIVRKENEDLKPFHPAKDPPPVSCGRALDHSSLLCKAALCPLTVPSRVRGNLQKFCIASDCSLWRTQCLP